MTEEAFFAEADVVIENPDRENDEKREYVSKQITTYLKECLESAGKMW